MRTSARQSRLTGFAALLLPLTLLSGVAAAQTSSPTNPAPASASPLTLVGGDMLIGAHNAPATPRVDRARASGLIGIDQIVAWPWPGGRMPVTFEANVSAERQAFFFEVCNRWSKVAGVACVPASGEEDALTVAAGEAGSGCNSVVGYGPYYRYMNLEPACWYDSVVLHEVGHALGLLHEHQRADRDAFIAINYGNVQPAYRFAFDYAFGAAHGPYDLRSVMHYQWYAFAADGARPALAPRDGQARLQDMGAGIVSGGLTFPSSGDAAAMRSLYGAHVDMPGAPGQLRLTSVAGNAVSLAWNPPASGAPLQGYRIELGTDRAFSQIAVSLPVAAHITSVAGPLPNGVMHVRVVPVGSAGDGVPSDALSFQLPGGQVIAPPQAPLLTAARTQLNPITLKWQSGGGGTPTAYTLVAGTTPNASDIGVFPMGLATSLTAHIPVDAPIYVRVIATNAAGSAVSPVAVVEVPSTVSVPVLAPAVVEGHTVVLSWTASAAATSYLVHARVAPDGPIVASWNVGGTALAVPNVPSGAYVVSISPVIGSAVAGESNRVLVVVP